MTMQAKFLLLLMLSYPTDWEFSLDHLSKQSKNGITATRSAFNELMTLGYVWRTRVRFEDGTWGHYDYTVTDVSSPI